MVLLFKNLLLNIVTVGFYRFWARARLRRFLWSNVELLGDPFVYTGTGMELFKGFLRALVVIVPLGALSVGIDFIPDPILNAAASVLFFALLFFLIFYAVYSARRYRLSRSTWRGVRFGMDGKAMAYAVRMMGWTLLSIVTLGFASPWMAVKAQRYLTEHTLFGDRRFAFDGKGRDLLGSWLLVYATLGIGYYWYAVKQFRYMTGHTSLGEARFGSAVRFWSVFGRLLLFMVAMLVVLMVVTGIVAAAMFMMQRVWPDAFPGSINIQLQGFAAVIPMVVISQLLLWPVVYIPILRHVCATMSIENAASLASIAQSAQELPQTGEGLADAFDVGLV